MKGKNLEDLLIYKKAVDISSKAWVVYNRLPASVKNRTGIQFVNSIDSIGANIAEGFGRFHFRDSIRFYYIARGSLYESKHWLLLLLHRQLIDEDAYLDLIDCLDKECIWINSFIKGIKY
ncbi:MAG TPA: four helix bundle protein [Bacteroidales bacterium]|nr:four helix bundle protein [Bacteroidales bacterium]